ncbi:MAG: DapH/DapD/GlmU-related protein [Terriglobales bacterium]
MKFNNRNVCISPRSKIGSNVRIGDNTVVYDNVEIGDNSIICNDVVLGEPLGTYYRDPDYTNPLCSIGANSVIRSHSIIYAGSRIGAAFSCGHQALIREKCTIGEHCSVGSLTDLEGEITIGNYSRIHSNVHISQRTVIGSYIWISPFVVVTHDPYPPSYDWKGSSIGDYTQVCVNAVILPGVQIGKKCVIGAGAVVNKSLKDFSLVIPAPSRIMDVRKYVVMGKGRVYPWMNRFDRGMPWEGIGYDTWIRQSGGAE